MAKPSGPVAPRMRTFFTGPEEDIIYLCGLSGRYLGAF
jgi:hypothetical protein